MFKRLHEPASGMITVYVEGKPVQVPEGETVANVLLAEDADHFFSSVVSGDRRGPHCMIGACFECLVEIDGVANRQACLTRARDGMRVERQAAVRKVRL
jgi:predicted molibdopterin-dependent oxidoreductase YjgC